MRAGSDPDSSKDPVDWNNPSHPRVIPGADGGTTQGHSDAGTTPPEVEDAAAAADGGTPAPPADAGPSDASAVEPPADAAPSATLIFNESPSSYVPSPAPQEFSIQSVRELYIHTFWTGLTGEHTETRKFFLPSGELYYQRLVPFSTDIDAPVPFDREVGIPHATSVQPTPPDADGNVIVTDYLSVAGTWISDRSLTGTWTLEIHLDEAATPAVSSEIDLVP